MISLCARRAFAIQELSKETLESMTFYEILKVKKNSTKQEIRNSYLRLARKHHPDLQQGPSLEFTYIAAAYQTLMDDQAKAAYDDKLVSDKDYFTIKLGFFSMSLKYLFLAALGGFGVLMAVTEGEDAQKVCPNDYKIKKVKFEVKETEEPEEEAAETTWMRLKKTEKTVKLIGAAPKSPKHIFANKEIRASYDLKTPSSKLPVDKTIINKLTTSKN